MAEPPCVYCDGDLVFKGDIDEVTQEYFCPECERVYQLIRPKD